MFVGPQASLVDFLTSWGHWQPEDVCPVCVPHKPSQLSLAYGSCGTCTFIVCLFFACTGPWAGRSFPPLGYPAPILLLVHSFLTILLTPLLPLHGSPSIIYSTNICSCAEHYLGQMCQALPWAEGTEPEILPAFLGTQTSLFAHCTVQF